MSVQKQLCSAHVDCADDADYDDYDDYDANVALTALVSAALLDFRKKALVVFWLWQNTGLLPTRLRTSVAQHSPRCFSPCFPLPLPRPPARSTRLDDSTPSERLTCARLQPGAAPRPHLLRF
jgi:hypothetical protein